VELFCDAAAVARGNIDHVTSGNIENPELMAGIASGYDLFVFGDVLEHLADPWATLKALFDKAAPQSTCIACIPNVAHWSIIAGLLGGKWNYQDAGLLDRTHLRFFTVETMIKMFQEAGWNTKIEAKPRILWAENTNAHIQALLPAAKMLGITEQTLITNCRAFQWIIKAERA
jgi:2-polyprenyl-3-methyl-5-hydroxy-6-metoxy-1,4-benzoquinol methylase